MEEILICFVSGKLLRVWFLSRFICLFAVCLCTVLSTGPALAQNTLTISDMRFGVHADKTRMVLELSRVSDFRTFVLPNPYRLVIDLRSFEWRVDDIRQPTGAGIKSVRNGLLEPGISRIVIDMQRPVLIKSAFILPAASGQPNRLVIDFSSASGEDFHRNHKTVYGTLKTTAPSFNLQTADPQLGITRSNIKQSAGGIAVPPHPQTKPLRKKPVIVIDAGHGGQDPGAVGVDRIYEKNVTLATAKELKAVLEQTGRYTVKLTRTNDSFIRLSNRVKLARQYGGDLFISIHADSIDKPDVRGASVYTLSDKASDTQTAKLAARENKADLIGGVDLTHEDKDVADILIDLAMRDTMNQSKFFANTLVDHLQKGGIKTLPSAHRYAGFAVLKAPDIPSVLTEIGFMSNKAEAHNLNNAGYRKKIVNALKNGIEAYFDRVQKNNNQ